MLPAHCGKPTLRRPTFSPAQSPMSLNFEASAPISALMTLQNNNFFQKFIQTFMERAKVLAALATKVRNNIDRPLKSQNSNL